MSYPGSLLQNNFLKTLPTHNHSALSHHLELIQLLTEEVLYRLGDALRYAALPTAWTASMDFITEQGASTEVTMIGNESIIYIIRSMDNGVTQLNRAAALTPTINFGLYAPTADEII